MSCKQNFKMSFSHLNPDIITKSSLFSKVTSNFGHRDIRLIKEELSEGTTTLSDSSNLCTSGYKETHRVAKHFGKFQTIFEAEVAIFFRTGNRRHCPSTAHPSERPSPVSRVVRKSNCTSVKTFRNQCSWTKHKTETQKKFGEVIPKITQKFPKALTQKEHKLKLPIHAIFNRLEQ